MSIITVPNKNNATLTEPVRHGKDPSIAEVQNLTFNDPMFQDGTLVKNVTFLEIQDQVWTTPSKNLSTLTTPTKN